MRNSSEAMEQHRRELNNQNQSEEEHKNQTDWFELKVFLSDVHLKHCIRKSLEIVFDNNFNIKQVIKPMSETQTSTLIIPHNLLLINHSCMCRFGIFYINYQTN